MSRSWSSTVDFAEGIKQSLANNFNLSNLLRKAKSRLVSINQSCVG